VDYANLVVRAIRILNANGIMHMSGHVAARDAGDPNVMWINSRKASRSSLTTRDIVRVDLRTGEPIGGGDEPPSEFHIHRAIFNRRPDVDAIVHSHPKHVVALSIAGAPLLPVTIDGAFLGASTPVYDDARHINTVERGERLADAIGDAAAVVMRGHGMVVVGRSVEEVTTNITLAEHNAEAQYMAMAMGTVRPLRGEELADVAARKASDHAVRKAFHYQEETARLAGALEAMTG
jgi:ribulose-5-phosphate 4-epimerase/fuculose-1-phosphate aldolase